MPIGFNAAEELDDVVVDANCSFLNPDTDVGDEFLCPLFLGGVVPSGLPTVYYFSSLPNSVLCFTIVDCLSFLSEQISGPLVKTVL